jgi:aminopeptidase N
MTLKTSKTLRTLPLIVITFLTVLISPVASQESPPIHHVLEVWLQPDRNQITVEDRITVPESFSSNSDNKLYFVLHGGLNPTSLTSGIKLEPVNAKSQAQEFIKLSKSISPISAISPEYFSLTLPSNQKTFSIKYQGKIYHPLNQTGEGYARGFEGTPGVISSKGVFLSGASNWIPEFEDRLVTFQMNLHLPPEWDAVSQGTRIKYDRNEKETEVTWESQNPQNEIYLIGDRFTHYSKKNGSTESMVFLRQPGADLADMYLEVTSRYIEMYSDLLGTYPYKKFALVENFWETGYGMPSFTLLGSRVIRLPFILHSSYPHEILHNWFGNGVYVNYETGNWAEGLTAYMADHLIKEQHDKAAEYRRGTLQKYTDYVSSQNDFPLMNFRSRHSSSTEAVGYGKALMFFHMLRQALGDKFFVQGLNAFYEKHKFSNAGFDDIRKAFEGESGNDLNGFFDQWISFSGAPEIKISHAKVFKVGKGYQLKATLEQVQKNRNYSLRVPLAVTMKGESRVYQTHLEMKDKVHKIELKLPDKPLRLDVDPEFDVFRRLDRNEIPPALSQVYGANKILVVLPSQEKSLIDGYKEFTDSLSRSYDEVEIKMDDHIQELPVDRSVWILGWENSFLQRFSSTLKDYGVTLDGKEVNIGDKHLNRKEHSLALATRHPANPDLGWAWIGIGNPKAVPGFARKLPHYHKYSYLAFEGDRPTNILKGKWPVLNSAMTVFLSPEKTAKPKLGKLVPRKALAYLLPPFSE